MADSREEEGTKWVGDVRQTYTDRDAHLPPSDWRRNIYHPRHPLGRLFNSQNRESLIDVLNDRDIELAQLTVLDVGCGFGAWLRYFVDLGARPSKLTGIDLSPERLATAREKNPAITWVEATGTDLPFSAESFDFVLQVLVFSSVPDDDARRRLAAEMDRVTRPGGASSGLTSRRPQMRPCTRFRKPTHRASSRTPR